MGGELNLGIGEAGFSPYVKIYKPWFIGRDAFIQREKDRHEIVIRFRFDNKHVRMAHLGDPVLEENGKVIGKVTSCAIDQDEFISGQAVVDMKHAVENNSIYIFQNASHQTEVAINNLKPGDRATLPSKAHIINRFLK